MNDCRVYTLLIGYPAKFSSAETPLEQALAKLKQAENEFRHCDGKDSGSAHFNWRDLRHTFISRLTMKGVDLRSVQQFAGHKTISMTMRYSHLAPSHLAAAIENLCEPTAIPTASGTDEAQEVKSAKSAVSCLQRLCSKEMPGWRNWQTHGT